MSDDDDAWSVCSEEASVVDFSVDGEADTTTEVTDQDFEDALDLLFERRGSTREEGLRKVFKVLCLTYSFELASERFQKTTFFLCYNTGTVLLLFRKL